MIIIFRYDLVANNEWVSFPELTGRDGRNPYCNKRSIIWGIFKYFSFVVYRQTRKQEECHDYKFYFRKFFKSHWTISDELNGHKRRKNVIIDIFSSKLNGKDYNPSFSKSPLGKSKSLFRLEICRINNFYDLALCVLNETTLHKLKGIYID